jgi:RNA polymerase sigma-70 factor (ECF subfamily)
MNPEREWAEKIRQGDRQAFAALMERYGDDIYRTAYLLLRDAHHAEDAAQDTFLTAYEKIGQFRGEGSLKSWLVKIAVNHCRRRMRRASWKKLLFRDILENEAVSPQNLAEEAGMRLSLARLIQRLPYKYREVIVLCYYQEMSVEEMAEHLGEKPGTVKSKLHRGRQLLKRAMREEGMEDAGPF